MPRNERAGWAGWIHGGAEAPHEPGMRVAPPPARQTSAPPFPCTYGFPGRYRAWLRPYNGFMREGRASFVDLLGRVDAYLTLSGQGKRLPGLEVFWQAAEGPDHVFAVRAFEKLLSVAQGQGFDVELLPFIEASRVWSRKVAALHDATNSRASPATTGSTRGPRPGRARHHASGR